LFGAWVGAGGAVRGRGRLAVGGVRPTAPRDLRNCSSTLGKKSNEYRIGRVSGCNVRCRLAGAAGAHRQSGARGAQNNHQLNICIVLLMLLPQNGRSEFENEENCP